MIHRFTAGWIENRQIAELFPIEIEKKTTNNNWSRNWDCAIFFTIDSLPGYNVSKRFDKHIQSILILKLVLKLWYAALELQLTTCSHIEFGTGATQKKKLGEWACEQSVYGVDEKNLICIVITVEKKVLFMACSYN